MMMDVRQVMVLEHKKLNEVVARHTRELPIADLKFSPDGRCFLLHTPNLQPGPFSRI